MNSTNSWVVKVLTNKQSQPKTILLPSLSEGNYSSKNCTQTDHNSDIFSLCLRLFSVSTPGGNSRQIRNHYITVILEFIVQFQVTIRDWNYWNATTLFFCDMSSYTKDSIFLFYQLMKIPFLILYINSVLYRPGNIRYPLETQERESFTLFFYIEQ